MNALFEKSQMPDQTVIQPLARGRLERAKRAFTTRRVDLEAASMLVGGNISPRPGDLVLARVKSIGHHAKLERCDGRRASLYEGDDVVLAYGSRYATDQFFAEVPPTLDTCDLVASGGVAGTVTALSDKARRPTRVTPYGLLSRDKGDVLNLSDFAIVPTRPMSNPFLVAVLGSSMNAGKTTAVAALTLALSRSGKKVSVAKVTGTGSGGDLWSALDAGAVEAVDFTDAGYPSTHEVSSDEIESVLQQLVDHLSAKSNDVIIVEIADGLLQKETADLVTSPLFTQLVDRVVFAAGDPMSALAGERWLAAQGIRPSLLTGQFTRSPLACAEVERNSSTLVLPIGDLRSGAWLPEDQPLDHLKAVG